MEPIDVHEIDQQRTLLVDHLGKTWAGLFRELKSNGMEHEDAMELVRTYIYASANPPASASEEEEKEEEGED